MAEDITQLLRAWTEGDQQALEKLTPLVYQELHRRAHRQMARERAGQTLQTTALVNEIYVHLVDMRGVSWRDRAPIVTDGPYVEAKEAVGGFVLLDVESAAEALEIARSWPGRGRIRIEVRPVVEGAGA